MKCQYCGAEMENGAKFCTKCGKPVTPPEEPVFCAGCGAKLSSNSQFCSKCGRPVSGAQQNRPIPPKKEVNLIAVAAAAILLIAGGIGIWSFLSHSQGKEAVPEEAPAQAAAFTDVPAVTEAAKPTAASTEPAPAPTTVPTEPITVPTEPPLPQRTPQASLENEPAQVYTMRNNDHLEVINSDDWNEQYFWGQEHYKREDIEGIQLLYQAPKMSTSAYSWDVSERKNGTVRAYVDANILYVVSDGRIGFPKDSSFLFAGFVNAKYIEFINAVDTSNVVSMERLFSGCHNLMKLDLSWFDTGRVENMKHMFAKCRSLMDLDVSMFDTARVTNMESMFYGCKMLTKLNLAGFDTSSVTTLVQMFAYCEAIPSIDVRSFDVRRVKYMTDMFRDCYMLKDVDVSGFQTISLQDINAMFYSCSELEFVDISGFDMSKVYCMVSTFERCSKLKNITAGNWNLQKNIPHKNFMDAGASINDMPWEDYLTIFD